MAMEQKMKNSQQKTIVLKAERNLLGHLLMLSQLNDVSLDKLFTYPLGPVLWSFATADGSFTKTDKSQLMHSLEQRGKLVNNFNFKDLPICTYIINEMTQLQSLVNLPETFENLAFNVFIILPKAGVVHFVTDANINNSIKHYERDQ